MDHEVKMVTTPNESRGAINSLYFTKRLLESMTSVLERPLTIVEAPVGYGKTTAVREFLKNKPADIAWVSITSESESASIYLATAEARRSRVRILLNVTFTGVCLPSPKICTISL